MAIPIGKLALYTAGCGIHPSLTLRRLARCRDRQPCVARDPLYLGYRGPRLRGAEYDALVEAFVVGVEEVWPGCLIQFEDFKQQNALRLLDRYQSRVPSFNDDIQGTAAVVVAGVHRPLRVTGHPLGETRVVLAGRGRPASDRPVAASWPVSRRSRWSTRRGSSTPGQGDLDATKSVLAVPAVEGPEPDLVETIRRVRPTVRDDRGGRHVRPGRGWRDGRCVGRASNRSCCRSPTRPRWWRPPRPMSSPGPTAAPSSRPAPRSRPSRSVMAVESRWARRTTCSSSRASGSVHRGGGADRHRQDVPPRGARARGLGHRRAARDRRALPARHGTARGVAIDRDRGHPRSRHGRGPRVGGRRRDVVAGIRPVSASSSR